MHSNKPTEVDSMNALRVQAERKNRELRSALLWILWHHQGASSIAGLAARRALGMGQFDHLTDEQIADAKEWDAAGSAGVLVDAPGCICDPTAARFREDCPKHAGAAKWWKERDERTSGVAVAPVPRHEFADFDEWWEQVGQEAAKATNSFKAITGLAFKDARLPYLAPAGVTGTRHQVQGPKGTDGQQDPPLSLSRGGGGEVDRP